MKNLASLAIGLLISAQANSASALVQMIDNCQTDNGLKITVINNEGIGPDRSNGQLSASIYNQEDQLIATFALNPPPMIEPVSFGRHPYTDKATQGREFTLAFPSTNFHHTSVSFILPNNVSYKSDNVQCASY